MTRFAKDRNARSLSISPDLPSTSPKENAGRKLNHNGSATGGPNSNGTGPGDEFVYLPAPAAGYPQNLSWDVSVGGTGSLAALVVVLEGSDDGFTTVSTIDTINSPTGGAKSVPNPGFQMYRLNVTTFTVNSGAPVIIGGITL